VPFVHPYRSGYFLRQRAGSWALRQIHLWSETEHQIEHGNQILSTNENELGHEIDVGHHVEHEDELA
jgi:hypothetical protein